MAGGCNRLKESLTAQLKALEENEHFRNHKWFRSEEARHDIGFEATLNSFAALPHYDDFARYFREKYCRYDCDCRDQCMVWREKQKDQDALALKPVCLAPDQQ